MYYIYNKSVDKLGTMIVTFKSDKGGIIETTFKRDELGQVSQYLAALNKYSGV